MELKCVGRYRSSLGSFDPGQVVSGADEFLGELLRTSPGSFEVVVAEPVTVAPEPHPEPEAEAESEPFDAMSTETATGLTVPDRRMRGGKAR